MSKFCFGVNEFRSYTIEGQSERRLGITSFNLQDPLEDG